MRKFLIGGAAALALVYVAAGFALSELVLRPAQRRSVAESHQALREGWGYDQAAILDALSTPREVTFASATEGLALRGWLFEPGGVDSAAAPAPPRCGIVMAHGITENRANVLKYARVLEDCGCSMLLYDHRGHGLSDGETLSGGDFEGRDVLAARRFLAGEAGLALEDIGLVGESWGAAAVLLAAARAGADDADAEPSPAFVVADSPYASWRDAIVERADKRYGRWLRALLPVTFAWVEWRSGAEMDEAAPAAHAARIDAPTLLVHSLADTITPPVHSERIGAALGAGVGEVRLLDWGAWHAHNALARPGEYGAMVRGFLRRRGVPACAP